MFHALPSAWRNKFQNDIRTLLEPAIKRGLLRMATRFEGDADDLPENFDFETAQNQIAQANSMFHALPSAWRNKFHNDPQQFLDWTANPNNANEMQNLGILKLNDGLDATGAPSGSPTITDKNADGIADNAPLAPAEPAPES